MLYLVMEYCERSLNDHYVAYREAGKIVPEDELKKILKQGLKGLLCLHAHEMVHLDIKP